MKRREKTEVLMGGNEKKEKLLFCFFLDQNLHQKIIGKFLSSNVSYVSEMYLETVLSIIISKKKSIRPVFSYYFSFLRYLNINIKYE
jgi:hypothetical protein